MNISIRCGLLFAAFLGSTAAMAGVPTAELTPLSINFNDKAPGQSLGAGGAARGEPVNLDALDTSIVASSLGENFLQVSNDLTSNNARYLLWEFEENAEFNEGLVSVSMEFTPSLRDSYSLGVRERGGSNNSFLSLDFSAAGRLYANDAAGLIGEYFNIYDAGDTIHIEILFDMNARTSSLTINGNTLFTERINGISNGGIGSVLTGYNTNSNGSAFALDNLLVLANVPLPLIFDTDFNRQSPGQPIGIGGAREGEPVYFSSSITQQAILISRNNVALRLWSTSKSPSQFARWEFLDDLEMRTGIVAFDMDVRFQRSQRYEISVNGPPNSTDVFSSIRFSPDRMGTTSGNVEIVDSRGSVRVVGAFRTNVFQNFQMTFDMDAGTYTAKLDGNVLVENYRHGVRSGNGIAALQTGFQSRGASGIPMDIDKLQVGASDSPLVP